MTWTSRKLFVLYCARNKSTHATYVPVVWRIITIVSGTSACALHHFVKNSTMFIQRIHLRWIWIEKRTVWYSSSFVHEPSASGMLTWIDSSILVVANCNDYINLTKATYKRIEGEWRWDQHAKKQQRQFSMIIKFEYWCRWCIMISSCQFFFRVQTVWNNDTIQINSCLTKVNV